MIWQNLDIGKIWTKFGQTLYKRRTFVQPLSNISPVTHSKRAPKSCRSANSLLVRKLKQGREREGVWCHADFKSSAPLALENLWGQQGSDSPKTCYVHNFTAKFRRNNPGFVIQMQFAFMPRGLAGASSEGGTRTRTSMTWDLHSGVFTGIG